MHWPLPVIARYRIYGLHLITDSAIPGLRDLTDASFPASADIHVEFGPPPPWVLDATRMPAETLRSLPACEETRDPAVTLSALGSGQFFQLYYSDGCRFVIDAATARVWGGAGPSQDMNDLAPYFLGPIMGYVLRHRGVTALHASAFTVDDKAVVLTGEAGAGKSTTVAALALRGTPVLCEDIAAVAENSDGFSIHSGYSRVCLWPESVAMLAGRPDALPRIAKNWEKCYLALDGTSASLDTQTRPLGAVYILAPRGRGNAPRVEEVSSRDALLELVQNTYMNWLLDRGQRAQEFELLSRLISHIPVRRIVPHADPAAIGALCELILADSQRLLTGKATISAAVGR